MTMSPLDTTRLCVVFPLFSCQRAEIVPAVCFSQPAKQLETTDFVTIFQNPFSRPSERKGFLQ